MTDTLTIPLRPVLIFIVVLARIGGLSTFAPFWGIKAIPVRLRVSLALAMSLVITPVVAGWIQTPPSDPFSLGIIVAGELAIGCAIGLAGAMLLSGLEMAAHLISSQMGFSLAGIIDPATRAQTTAFGVMAQMCGLSVLLAMDGHHWLLASTVKSFQGVPPGSFSSTAALAELFIRLSADGLAIGLALAGPAMIVLLTVEIALAIAGRVMPQLQVLLLGFPVKIAVGLWVIGASLYLLPGAVRHVLGALRPELARLFETLK